MKAKQSKDYNAPTKQFIIDMKKSYPFGEKSYEGCQSMIRYRKEWAEGQFQKGRHMAERICKLKHDNLINITKALESKKNNYIEIYYEHVTDGFECSAHKLREEYFNGFKIQLTSLFKYIISNGINPEVTADRVGFEASKIKYFLSCESESINTHNREELFRQKQQEILSFLVDTCKRRNFRLNHSSHYNGLKSAQNLLSTQLLPKEPRNSSCSGNSGNLVKSVESNAFSKIKTIDDKINDILAKMRKPSFNIKENHSKQKKTTEKSNEIGKYSNSLEVNQVQIRQVKAVYPSKLKQFDEQSTDTYRLELGQVLVMPKISNSQMRQTTKSPPKLVFNKKLHQSVGNNGEDHLIEDIRNAQKSLNIQSLQMTKRISGRSQQSFNSNLQSCRTKEHDVGELRKQANGIRKQASGDNFRKKKQSLEIKHNGTATKILNFKIKKQSFDKLNTETDNLRNKIQNHFEQAKHRKSVDILEYSNARKYSQQSRRKESLKYLPRRQQNYRKDSAKLIVNTNLGKVVPELKTKINANQPILQSSFEKSNEIIGFDDVIKTYEIEQEVVGDFNTLFSIQNTPRTLMTPCSQQRAVSSDRNVLFDSNQSGKRRPNQPINERVLQALIKSQATLECYQKKGQYPFQK